jgi:hypothetical protein
MAIFLPTVIVLFPIFIGSKNGSDEHTGSAGEIGGLKFMRSVFEFWPLASLKAIRTKDEIYIVVTPRIIKSEDTGKGTSGT